MQRTILDGKHTAMMLAVVFIATFMDGLDGSVVSVALPDIGDSLGVDTATSSWVTIIYMMVLAGLLVLFARIAADRGVRKVMAAGLAVFTVGSLFCGISPDFWVLIASRAFQAVGAAMMAAAGPMCCTEHLPPGKLGTGLAVVTIGSSVGFALGPALGGIIVDVTTWHWIFLINIPIGILTAPLVLKAIPPSAEKVHRGKLDLKGTALLFAAVASGIFAVETLSYDGFIAYTSAAAVLCIVLLAAFIAWERRQDSPLLKLSMFARKDFTAIFLCLMLINLAYMGILYLIPFYGRIVEGMSSMEVGLFLLEAAGITAVLGLPVARWSDRRGRRWFCVTAGLVTAIAFGMFAAFAGNIDFLLFSLIMIPQGLGWAFVGGPMASRLVEHAGSERDMASSLTNEGYYIGGALGTAIAAAMFTFFSGSGGVDISDVTRDAFLDGFVPTAAFVTACCLTVAFISWAVRDKKE
ncbi:MAG: arabinose transporter permease [Methanomethylophilus alvi]|nr:MAG: arabinose transporter permease [Methanomethylophilus alvi]